MPLICLQAGISVGICTGHDDLDKISDYKLLTDIIGWEDGFCDMDCKLWRARTGGITGFQLTSEAAGHFARSWMVAETVERARRRGLFVLAEMG